MSFGSHNPELLDEITTKALPKEWRDKVELGEIDLYDVPEKIRDKAMDEGLSDYWGSRIDEAMMRAKDRRINGQQT